MVVHPRSCIRGRLFWSSICGGLLRVVCFVVGYPKTPPMFLSVIVRPLCVSSAMRSCSSVRGRSSAFIYIHCPSFAVRGRRFVIICPIRAFVIVPLSSFVRGPLCVVACSWFVRSSSSVVVRFWLFACGLLCEVVCLAPSVSGALFVVDRSSLLVRGHISYVIVRS